MAQKKISHHVPHLVENCCQQPNAQKTACVGKHAYLQSAYTKDEEAALKWKEELMAEFPGMEFQQDPLSLSVACHIGAGALAVAWTHKIDD